MEVIDKENLLKLISIGMGIIIGSFLQQFFRFAWIEVSPRPNAIMEIISLLLIIFGVVMAVWIIKKSNIKGRLNNGEPNTFIKIGIIIYLSAWLIALISRTIPYAVYVVGSIDIVGLLFIKKSYYLYTVGHALLTIGFFKLLVSLNSVCEIESKATHRNHEMS